MEPVFVWRNGKQAIEGEDYTFVDGELKFTEPLKESTKKWWQFWKKDDSEKVLIVWQN